MEVDIFSWIAKESQISTSQESYLRKCPFAGQPEIIQCDGDDSDSTPVRIIMVSPPASPVHGDAKCSLPDNNSSDPELTVGLKEPMEKDITDNLGSSDKGKAPMVTEIPDLNETPVVEQVKPPTTDNEIFSNTPGALKIVAGDHDDNAGGSEAVNLMETAMKRGMAFPRPRWWKDTMPCAAVKLIFKKKNKTI